MKYCGIKKKIFYTFLWTFWYWVLVWKKKRWGGEDIIVKYGNWEMCEPVLLHVDKKHDKYKIDKCIFIYL